MPATPAPRTSTATAARHARAAAVAALAEHGGLWPPLDWHPCVLCALPRRTPEAELCRGCRRLRALYGDALTDLQPLALSARDWTLGATLRAFKDRDATDPDSAIAHGLAAVLSSALEARLAPSDSGSRGSGPLITCVPSARPAIPAALERARREGWWAPDPESVARARPGVPTQRRRRGPERLRIEHKWVIEAAAVRDRDLLVLDDICTTGATLHSFARALLDAGARSVRALVLARNVGPDGHWILPLLQTRHAIGVRWQPTVRTLEPLT